MSRFQNEPQIPPMVNDQVYEFAVCLCLLSTALIKHHDWKHLGEEGAYFSLYLSGHTIIPEESQEESQGRNVEMGQNRLSEPQGVSQEAVVLNYFWFCSCPSSFSARQSYGGVIFLK